MDFLKTLLVYMSLMSALAVQEGPVPETVPTPTPLPPMVTATLVPFQTEAPTPSPTPTPPPVPTITPNARYGTLRYQDHNNDVRKLQRRLIELGYLPEGSADGSYGYQTYNAVREFQRVNGLDADGVAGPATLTNLYDNALILPKHTATPKPTDAPMPTLETLPTPPPAWTDSAANPGVTFAPDVTPVPQVNALGLTEVVEPMIFSGVTGEMLTLTATVDGQTVHARPHLWVNPEGTPVLSLLELADCMSGWSLGGSSYDGHYTLLAAGYTVEIQCTDGAAIITVDGQPVAVDEKDLQLHDGVIYVTTDFLKKTLSAATVFDADEHSLVLRILDKRITQAQ